MSQVAAQFLEGALDLSDIVLDTRPNIGSDSLSEVTARLSEPPSAQLSTTRLDHVPMAADGWGVISLHRAPELRDPPLRIVDELTNELGDEVLLVEVTEITHLIEVIPIQNESV
ncbi:MAG: hypothetical protein ABSC41_11395, partial [Acidimicrobiales bacterium]